MVSLFFNANYILDFIGIDSFMDWFIKEKRHNTHKKGQLKYSL